jgi:hypothetical protein
VKAIFRLTVLLLLLSGWCLAAAAIHVIRTPTTITIVSRDRLGCPWDDVFVDTRQWTIHDVGRHPAVVWRLIQLDRAELLANVVDPDNRAGIETQLREALASAASAARNARTGEHRGQEPLTFSRAVTMLDIAWAGADRRPQTR